ncbi:MAG: hypothetical protein ACLRWQ_21310 [Flavonifractor plautii]
MCMWMAVFVVIPTADDRRLRLPPGGGFTLENFSASAHYTGGVHPLLSSWPSSPPPSACCMGYPLSPASWPGRAPGSSVWP